MNLPNYISIIIRMNKSRISCVGRVVIPEAVYIRINCLHSWKECARDGDGPNNDSWSISKAAEHQGLSMVQWEHAEEVESGGLVSAPNGASACYNMEARNNNKPYAAREKCIDYLRDNVTHARNEAVSPYFAT